MAGFNLKPEFQQDIGSRPSPSDPNQSEFFRKDRTTGEVAQPFSNPEQLFNFASTLGQGQITSFDQLRSTQTGATPVKLDVKPQLPETEITKPLTTSAELADHLLVSQEQQTARMDTFLTEMKALQEQTLEATKPTEQEKELQLEISDITQQARELRASFKAGVDKITGQPIAMSLAMGQTRELENQVNRKLEGLSLIQAPLVDTLKTLQSAREVKLTQLGILQQFAQQNFQLLQQNSQQAQELTFQIFQIQQEEARYQRQEQKAARDFAIENNITAPAYEIGGIIYNTQTGNPEYRMVGQKIQTLDGKGFATPKEFFAHSGLTSFEQIQKVPSATQGELDTQVITANGRTLLVNKQTGKIMQDFGSAYKDTDTSNDKPTISETSDKAEQFMEIYKGGDGFASPENWQIALNAWIDDGFKRDDFVARFKKYVNPADPQDYIGVEE